METRSGDPRNIDALLSRSLRREQLEFIKNKYGEDGYRLFSAFLGAFASASSLKPEQRDEQVARYLADEVTVRKRVKFDLHGKFPTFRYGKQKLLTVVPRTFEGRMKGKEYNYLDTNGRWVTLRLDSLASHIISAASQIHGQMDYRNEMGDRPPSFQVKQRDFYTAGRNTWEVRIELAAHIISATENTAQIIKQRSFLGRMLQVFK